jgi:hypothetical protein
MTMVTHPLIDGQTGASAPAHCELGVVSTRSRLSVALQQRLDRVAPQVYQVTQVETRTQLEAALWGEGARGQPRWDACLIDTSCPTMQGATRAYLTRLASFTRPVALLDVDIREQEQVLALLDMGFHTWLPMEAGGAFLHGMLCWLLRLGLARGVHTERLPGQSTQHCPRCLTLLPATAQFCGACGTPLSAALASRLQVLTRPSPSEGGHVWDRGENT